MVLMTSEKELKRVYIMTDRFFNAVKHSMEKSNQKKVWSKKDIKMILQAYSDGYEEVHKTKLYNKYGSVYCRLIEVMSWHEDKLQVKEYYI